MSKTTVKKLKVKSETDIEPTEKDIETEEVDEVKLPCPSCNGMGLTDTHSLCAICNGTGI